MRQFEPGARALVRCRNHLLLLLPPVAGIPGTLDSLEPFLCPFRHLRELDLDGSRFTGPVLEWVSRCFRAFSAATRRQKAMRATPN